MTSEKSQIRFEQNTDGLYRFYIVHEGRRVAESGWHKNAIDAYSELERDTMETPPLSIRGQAAKPLA